MLLGCLYDSKKDDQTLAIEPMHKKSLDMKYHGFESLTGEPCESVTEYRQSLLYVCPSDGDVNITTESNITKNSIRYYL